MATERTDERRDGISWSAVTIACVVAGAIAFLSIHNGPSTGSAATLDGGAPAWSDGAALVARSAPMRVIIPAIHVDAPVVQLGLNPDGTLEVPSNFADAGWWSGGPAPGQRGPAVIVGHVDSVSGPAVFYHLRDLQPGDVVIVKRADGKTARFSVTSKMEAAKSDFPSKKVYGSIPYPGLRLITCTGTFDRAWGHYLDNEIVFARLID